MNVKEMKSIIKDNNYIEFFKYINTFNNEEELFLIDKYLLNNKDFNFHLKLDYISKYDRKLFLNDLMNDVRYQPLYYDYYAITYVALKTGNKKYKNRLLLDSLIKLKKEDVSVFRELLRTSNYYEEFINYIKTIKSDSALLKVAFYISDEIFDYYFKDKKVIDIVKFIDSSNSSIKMKIDYLLILANRNNVSLEDRILIKEKILEYEDKYKELLINELEKYDKELVMLFNNNEDDKEKGTVYLYK